MKCNIYILILSSMFFVGCDHISEDERLIEVESHVPTDRNVLLEDFTGQRCPNCPFGADVINQLEEAYGERLIAVAIHSGPLGFHGNSTVKGLATDTGDDYYNHWNLEYQPVGLINRGAATNYTDWVGAVRQEIEKTSDISMDLSATLNDATIDIAVTASVISDTYNGNLQVWVVEDNIVALQSMPDYTNNKDYVHNHVFRATVNGEWGETVSISKNSPIAKTYSCPVNTEWEKGNLSVVAFVYDDGGVEQVVKTQVNN